MRVLLSERVKTALKTFNPDERERVQAWLGYLQTWEEDGFVKAQSVPLEVQGRTVYLFRTSTELRIFYTVDLHNKTIEVIDITTRETILSFGNASAGKS